MRDLYLTIITLVLAVNLSYTQVYVMDGETNPVNCSGSFVDPGGLSDEYPASVTLEALICPDGATGTHIRLDFQHLDLIVGDTIRFFDGMDAAAPEIELPIDIHNFDNFSVQASAINSSGCVFVQFQSDAEGQADGWRAEIHCQTACQRIDTEIVAEGPADEGDNIFHFCPGDTARFTSNVVFPQNDFVYSQSVQSSNFIWKINGQETNFLDSNLVFPLVTSGFYNIELQVIDAFGCTNSYEGNTNVIVGSEPEVVIDESLNMPICPGEIVDLFTYFDLDNPLVGVGLDTTLDVIAINYLQQELIFDEPFPLPDGSGGVYTTSLQISGAPGDAMVGSELPLDSVWFQLEHSYSGDLDIEIVCPDGAAAFIMDFPSNTGSVNFGEPWASSPVDGQSNDLTPGVPYRYTIMDTAETTFADFADFAPTYVYTTVPSEVDGDSFTYKDRYFPEGAYRPEELFTNLYGCPINGEWTLRFVDNLGLDNGFVFGWGLAFTGAVESVLENTVSWQWESDPSIIDEEENSIEVLIPNNELSLTFVATDTYGCTTALDYIFDILPIDIAPCDGVLPTTPSTPVDPFPWPNPFQDDLNYNLTIAGPSVLQVLNSSGQLIYQDRLEDSGRIDTSSWPSGVYVVRLHQIQGSKIYTARVIKQ